MMSDQELDALARDITQNGQHEPIIYDADSVLVDGRWVNFLSNCVGLRTSKSTVRHCRMTNPNGQRRPC